MWDWSTEKKKYSHVHPPSELRSGSANVLTMSPAPENHKQNPVWLKYVSVTASKKAPTQKAAHSTMWEQQTACLYQHFNLVWGTACKKKKADRRGLTQQWNDHRVWRSLTTEASLSMTVHIWYSTNREPVPHNALICWAERPVWSFPFKFSRFLLSKPFTAWLTGALRRTRSLFCSRWTKLKVGHDKTAVIFFFSSTRSTGWYNIVSCRHRQTDNSLPNKT